MIKRGQIYFVTLDPTRGREQAGRRPVLVVSDDAINRQDLVVLVVPGSKADKHPKDYPTTVRVTAEDTGLPSDTVFLCFQLRALDSRRFASPGTGRPMLVGRLPIERMREVKKALRLVLAL